MINQNDFLKFELSTKKIIMQNLSVHAIDISEDTKMTRIYLASPSNFFESDVQPNEKNKETYPEKEQ